ncbi:HEAT repeat domain-containing protein [Romeria aff. gracilis LEGE 07310]|uniref:HEAT repeat domain-containing protein n=1 Tax=Vasconcelosia minhoensis LEGE 07310 TaxID=915328 RepID=A0A8J7APU7_9CYAN|nr:HEAT repeat domain-containing protein [Romeria gracilis]MBE9079050.1 HEAT repeat domain-containing protein [Romeria aff. gracilis LEGE 07310]
MRPSTHCSAQDSAPAAIASFQAITTAEFDALFEQLVAGDFQARWDLAKQFPDLGKVAIAPLIWQLHYGDLDTEARWFIIRILGKFNQPAVVAAIAKLMVQTDETELSEIAASTLAEMGPTAVAALTDLLDQPEQRPLAARALAKIRSVSTIEPLLKIAVDPEPALRSLAIEALGSFHDPRVTPILLGALADPDSQPQREAVAALGRRPDLLPRYDLLAALTPCLANPNLPVSTAAAVSIGRLGSRDSSQTGSKAAVQVLGESLLHPARSESLQVAAVRALGWIEHSLALDYLSRVLTKDLDLAESAIAVRCEAVGALSQFTQPELQAAAAADLLNYLEQPAFREQPLVLKQAVVLGLARLNATQAADSLIRHLDETEPRLRLHIIAALRQLVPQTAPQRLRQQLQQPDLSAKLKAGLEDGLKFW